MSPTAISGAGEWWRVLTAVFLHADLSHLFFNAVVLFGAGYTLEVLVGRAWLTILFLLGGICGSLLSLTVDASDRTEVGASGAIMALLAALIVVSFHAPRGSDRTNLQIGALRFFIPSLIPLGSSAGGEQIAYAAHFGGAIGGGLMGLAMLGLWPQDSERPRLGGRLAALVSCCALGALFAALPPLVRHHVDKVDTLYAQALADMKADRNDRAIDALSQAIDVEAYDGTLYSERGIAYRRTGNTDRAIDDLGQAIRLNGKDANFFRERGFAYEDAGQYDRAIDDYAQALRLTSDRPSPSKADQSSLHNDIGVAYRRKGDDDRAIAEYNEAIRLDPQNSLAHDNRGRAYARKRDDDKAIADFTEAIRIDRKRPRYFYDRALAASRQKKYDDALADVTQAIGIDANDPYYLRERGIIYENKGDLDRAIADYTQAIRLKPDYATAFNDRGVAYLTKGDRDNAIADYSEAIRIDPTDPLAIANRGKAYFRKGDLDRAVVDLTEALRIRPDYASARDTLQSVRKALAAKPSETPK